MKPAPVKNADTQDTWSIDESSKLYRIPAWSEGYFDINEGGDIIARPGKAENHAIHAYQPACQLREQGQTPPVLLRFTDILQQRVDELCEAFAQARQQFDYQSAYTAVYPIKVNQQRKVIEDIIRHGGKRIGLEAGSKPELL